MAMNNCCECKFPVSDKALICPKCGCPDPVSINISTMTKGIDAFNNRP